MTLEEFSKLVNIKKNLEGGIPALVVKCPFCEHVEIVEVHYSDFHAAELLLLTNLRRHVKDAHGILVGDS